MTDKDKKTPAPSGHVPRSALSALAGNVEMAGSLPGSPAAPASIITAHMLPPMPRGAAVDIPAALRVGQAPAQQSELIKHARATSLQNTSMANATKLRGGGE